VSANSRFAVRPEAVLLGPTASGKSALALEVAQLTGAVIVCADSRTSYIGLDIGTAKPDSETLAAVPHVNIDVLHPEQRDNPTFFEQRVHDALKNFEPDRPVIYCGGSTLYLQQLLFGSDSIPSRNELNTSRIETLTESRGKAFIKSWLEQVDPEYARQVDGFNPVRIYRALDVWLQTSRPFSSFHTLDTAAPRIMSVFGLTMPRALLVERIKKRTSEMFQMGFVEEVEQLLANGANPEWPSLRTVGYKEVIQGLERGASRQEMEKAVIASTVAYAKRQLTWFKRWPFIQWFDVSTKDKSEIVACIASKLGNFART
jgi:tRNA dimethylallyltransferase